MSDSRHVRVAGKLEEIQLSERRFVLVVDGHPLQGVARDSITPDDLAVLFGQQVIVTGDAVFRPSGAIRRLDAVGLERAGAGSSVWAKLPRPLFERIAGPSPYRQPQIKNQGLSAIIGRWPGNETDEELAAALEELS